MTKTFTAIFVICSLSAILALPAPSPSNIKDEIEIVPLERQNSYGGKPIVDTDAGFGGFFSSNPFGDLFENLEGIMTRMRQQMQDLLKRFPGIRGNATDELPDFPVPIAGRLPPIPSFGDFDLGKGNTTSVTKVIDGHKVVINETEYKKEDDFGGAYFKVRIIDLKPDSSELTTRKDTENVPTSSTIVKDREPMEDSFENEILKSREASNFDKNEAFDDVDNFEPIEKISLAKQDAEWNDFKPIETVADNSLNFGGNVPPIDLSRDIYVNQIMANAGATTNPDAEVFYDTRQPQIVKRFEKLNNPR